MLNFSISIFISFLTSYYAIIAVKVKTASFKKNSTNSYSNFETYESAEYDKPYITAVFNATIMNDGFNSFTLGKKINVFFFCKDFLVSFCRTTCFSKNCFQISCDSSPVNYKLNWEFYPWKSFSYFY